MVAKSHEPPSVDPKLSPGKLYLRGTEGPDDYYTKRYLRARGGLTHFVDGPILVGVLGLNNGVCRDT